MASTETARSGGRRLAGLVASVAALLSVVGLGLAPVATVPTASGDDAGAQLARVCPGLDGAGSLGFGVAGTGASVATLGSPTSAAPVASGAIQPLTKDAVRLSAPAGTSFWGVASASAASGADLGLALVPCRQPRSESWITGVRSDANAQSDLVLVNLDGSEADVNVGIFGVGGPLSAAGGRGLVVGPRSQRVVPLGPIASTAGPLTLQVTASSGRVAAFVRQRLFDGVTPLGADWIAAGAAPDTTVVLPSVAAGAGLRTLVIGNPDDRTVQVKVEVLGSDGAFAPVGLEQVDVPAKATREFNLDSALAGKAAAIRLTGTRGIVAAIEARTAADWATLDGVPPVGPGATVTVPLPAGVAPVVTLSNPSDAPITVDASLADGTGKSLASKSVELAASSSLSLEPGAVTNGVLTVKSSGVALRVSLVATGAVGTVPGIAVLPITDASSEAPTVKLTRDPGLGSRP